MSVRNLEHLFNPKSVAVIGASSNPAKVGSAVLRNLIEGGFPGPIFPVNPKYDRLYERVCYPRVADLPASPELAIVSTPPATVPEIVADLGRRGTKAVVVMTAGITDARRMWGKSLKEAMLSEARPHLLRVLGPSCMGLLVPEIRLNASFAHVPAHPGKLAFLTQSGALGAAVLDWARERRIGFSKFISMGDAADIDFGDLLDYLASDADTKAVLMFMEAIRDARKFMSAARACARNKPVVVMKAGRAPESAQAAALHTGVLAGPDEVYDAAIRRAGMLRVFTTEDLFDAVESLARARPLSGDRLAILTNGGGPGIIATDALVLRNGRLATLASQTLERLAHLGPQQLDVQNPVDILGDAPVQRYADAMDALLQDPDSDALLVVHAPNALVDSLQVAETVAQKARGTARNVITCWPGGEGAGAAREAFGRAGVPTYDTPEKAVSAFLQIVQYRRNQELLMQVPPSVPERFTPDTALARWVVRGALAHGRDLLTEPEAKAVLAAYGIPVVETRHARSAEEAVRIAHELGFPVAVKICSHEIAHKSQVEGVALHLSSGEEVRGAVRTMRRRLKELRPDATLRGFTVQRMERRAGALELIVGAATDLLFGPVILFGHGGTAVEVTADRAVGLPPLNPVLARDLVSRTKVAKLIDGYGGHAPADLDAICLTLIQVSQMVTDIAEIAELDINPLLADQNGVIALDARIRVVASERPGVERLAIRPYPKELEETVRWQGREILLRPIKPEDGPQHLEFFNALDPDDVRMRLFVPLQRLAPTQLARLTQIDYDREMAFVASEKDAQGNAHTLGVVRGVTDPDNSKTEFAITVRSDLKGQGLGPVLLDKLVRYCRGRGTPWLVGETLSHNTRLLKLVQHFGTTTRASPEPGVIELRLDLRSAARVPA